LGSLIVIAIVNSPRLRRGLDLPSKWNQNPPAEPGAAIVTKKIHASRT